MPQELMKQLAELESNTPEIAKEMAEAGCEVLLNNVKTSVASHKRSGELAKSFKRKKGKQNSKGEWICKFTADGYDKTSKPSPLYPRGKPNAIKAIALEYGTAKQSPTPFLRPTLESSRGEIESAINNAFSKNVKGKE